VSRRREIEEKLHALGEIRDVLDAMKNLALMETRKLARFLATQQRVVESVDAALEDFASFHAPVPARAEQAREVCLLVGSERGFCGDFNEAILAAVEAHLAGETGTAALVTVGYKLSTKLENDPRVVARIDGAAVVEEVEPALMRLMERLGELTAGPRPLRLTAIHHSPERGDVQVRRLDPVGHGPEVKRYFSVPPVLNLHSRVLLTGIVEHYLDAHLHELIYVSLMAENLRRLQHMDGAIRHIDGESGRLRMRSNSLRQEEITEEIELILLTAESLLRNR
jgi:F-type H+-transporting ATPase subunit gamma